MKIGGDLDFIESKSFALLCSALPSCVQELCVSNKLFLGENQVSNSRQLYLKCCFQAYTAARHAVALIPDALEVVVVVPKADVQVSEIASAVSKILQVTV